MGCLRDARASTPAEQSVDEGGGVPLESLLDSTEPDVVLPSNGARGISERDGEPDGEQPDREGDGQPHVDFHGGFDRVGNKKVPPPLFRRPARTGVLARLALPAAGDCPVRPDN